MTNVFYILSKLFKLALLFAFFGLLMMFLLWILPVPTYYYQENDVPHRLFRVLVQTENGFRQPETWENAQKLPPNQWAKQIDEHENCTERCLRQNANGDWVLRHEYALAETTSVYRIENNRLVPVSFGIFSIEHFAVAVLGAMILGQYALGCWRHRHSRELWVAYHRDLWGKILNGLRFLAIGGLILGLYVLMKWVQAG